MCLHGFEGTAGRGHGCEEPCCTCTKVTESARSKDVNSSAPTPSYTCACLLAQYMNAKGSFQDAHTVIAEEKNGNKTTLTADRIVVAVGGRPKYPGVPGEG